jgi:hypothetical protein
MIWTLQNDVHHMRKESRQKAYMNGVQCSKVPSRITLQIWEGSPVAFYLDERRTLTIIGRSTIFTARFTISVPVTWILRNLL